MCCHIDKRFWDKMRTRSCSNKGWFPKFKVCGFFFVSHCSRFFADFAVWGLPRTQTYSLAIAIILSFNGVPISPSEVWTHFCYPLSKKEVKIPSARNPPWGMGPKSPSDFAISQHCCALTRVSFQERSSQDILRFSTIWHFPDILTYSCIRLGEVIFSSYWRL